MASRQVEEAALTNLSSCFSFVYSCFFRKDNEFDNDEGESNVGETVCHYCLPEALTQSDLDEMLAEDKPIERWEPANWTWIRTLAEAAAGAGTVQLMSIEEHAGKHVAVKRLPSEIVRSSPKEFIKQFPKAAECPWTDIAIVKHLNGVNFPYSCELLGVFLGSDEVNIVTSFATQGDLFSWVMNDMSEVGEARETAMRPIATQMCEGVCWLHDLGIAHRDLSAENLLLTDDGVNGLLVKIIDFGMATLSRKVKREVRGKRSYQAPEMHGPLKYDTFLSDNFALGVIVYFMGVHCLPWENTRPGKDKAFEFAQSHGLEKFMMKKRLPCSNLCIAEAFSESCYDLICGLLDFDPETRHSLGEACFHPANCKAKSSWMRGEDRDALSEVSTECSFDSLPMLPQEQSSEDLYRDEQVPRVQPLLSRTSVWDCQWLL